MSGAFVLIGLAALMNQHRLAAVLAMASSLAFTRAEHSHTGRIGYIYQTMEALNSLKAAGKVWDSVVSDTLELMEGEERSSYYAATPPHSSSSPLRIALHSSLTTTQQQCDNVRPLLAALASPKELSQLSEMYAPPVPSPAKGGFQLSPNPRASSSTASHKRASRRSLITRSADFVDTIESDIHTTPTPRDKRSTWNGPFTYMSLANFDKPSSRTQVMRQRVRRRSDIRSLVEGHQAPATVPATPQPAVLANVPEADAETDDERDEINALISADQETDHFTFDTGLAEGFGKAALNLRRRRRASGIQSLGLVSSHSDPVLRSSPRLGHTPNSSVSRFTHTPLQLPRHPLSISALRATLHSALAARRYACAHLLALRFHDDSGTEAEYEDETYWENVRAIMELLTSTLEDASSRLAEALEEAVGRVSLDGSSLSAGLSPCPSPSLAASPESAASQPATSSEREREITDALRSWRNTASQSPAPSSPRDPFMPLTPRSASPSQPSNARHLPLSPLSAVSFAPAPTRLARFAEHVDAISSALEDAKGHLWESVKEVREAEGKDRRSSLASSSSAGIVADDAVTNEEDAALQAYDRLRRELGLALRECERGRGVLLNIIEARRRSNHPHVEQDYEDTANSPTSVADAASGDSESDGKHDGSPATPNDGSPILALPSLESVLASQYQPLSSRAEADDDVTQHLLLTSTPTHLPAPGAEQVYECELGPELAPSFNRERSRLSRAERIRLVKAKRESGQGSDLGIVRAEDTEQEMDREKRSSWGPGTEVVQELKDVIWKVSERKRRMASGSDSGFAVAKSATSSPQVHSSLPLHHNSDSTSILQQQTGNDFETTLETI
jgi:hypothetical protein